MTATETFEYRKLELDSSNDIIRHDARRSDRKYSEAALRARDAGLARLRMGQMMFDAEDFSQAAADWLSAAACFYLATDPKQMQDALDRVRQLDRKGKIPPERRDIHAALKEREAELKALEQKLSRFQEEYTGLTGPAHTASQESLNWLLGQIRELPGHVYLHAAIASQAGRLGQRPLASEYLTWAEQLAPGDPQLKSFRASLLLVSGELERGNQMARESLEADPEMHDLRFLLANCIAFPRNGKLGDWEEAVRLLRPLTDGNSGAPITRLRAFALAAVLRHGLGHEADYQRHLMSFNQLADSTGERDFVTELRQDLPRLFPQPGNNRIATSANQGHHPSSKVDYEKARHVFEKLNHLAV